MPHPLDHRHFPTKEIPSSLEDPDFPVHAENGVPDPAVYSNHLAGESGTPQEITFQDPGTFPSGFKHMGVPKADAKIFIFS